MMKKYLFIVAAALAVIAVGCENDNMKFQEVETDGEELTIAEDEVFSIKSAESTDSDIDAANHAAGLFRGGMGVRGAHHFLGNNFPKCATVTVSGATFPKEIVIDYGDGCSGRQGMGRAGTVSIVMSDTITVAGAVYTVTFDSVTVGNRLIEKTSTMTNEGVNENGNWVISSEMVMITTKKKQNNIMYIKREFSGQKEWLSGFETPENEDDQFLKSGGGTITVNDSMKFEREITEPLFIDRTCRYPMSGVVEITRNDEFMTINYGDGECDNIALVTKDGIEEEIELEGCEFKKEFRRKNKNMKKKKGWW
ncbi:MAG: hypothetical protein GY790_15765 [Bacteroidetes bacterium]|nr:hypothetical protein [Bacteroidota bacterium]